VFGSNPNASNDAFLEAASRKTQWVFSSTDLRKKVFMLANVKPRFHE